MITGKASQLPRWNSTALEDCSETPKVYWFDYQQYYLPGSPHIRLFVTCWREKHQRKVIVTARQQAESWGAEQPLTFDKMPALARQVDAPVIAVDSPWRLEPVDIPKPWGREVWFTGIESRGISAVSSDCSSVPLSWLIGVAPELLLGAGLRTPALLKILDPLPEEVYGDLYFELHVEKREVYVVTEVSPLAWPTGVGEIRYGFSPAMRRRYSDDAAFKKAFSESVARYREVRQQIDALFDRQRLHLGIGLDQPVPPQLLKNWAEDLPATLKADEHRLRKATERFTHRVPLRVGDVVKISPLSPHSLQHGVKTVEFQNPVYERKILSFGQKVLTQPDWDTEQAIEIMSLQAGSLESLQPIESEEGVSLEQVVAFEDFNVQRLTLAPEYQFAMDKAGYYVLIMVIKGSLVVKDAVVESNRAVLVPASVSNLKFENRSVSKSICLILRPTA